MTGIDLVPTFRNSHNAESPILGMEASFVGSMQAAGARAAALGSRSMHNITSQPTYTATVTTMEM